jgi:hypothetical protein
MARPVLKERRMSSASVLRAGLAAALLGLFLFATQTVLAQTATITVTPNSVTRSKGIQHSQYSYVINYDDCIKDNGFNFTLYIPGGTFGRPLQAWVGSSSTNCSNVAERNTTTGHCWKVYDQVPSNNANPTITVGAQEIITGSKEGGAHKPGTANPADCEGGDPNAEITQLTFYFMTVEGTSDQIVAGPATWSGVGTTPTATNKTGFDIGRPPPPTNVEADSGENRLSLEFTASTARDRAGYQFYCQRSAGGSSRTDGGSEGAAGTTADSALDNAAGTGGTGGAPEAGLADGATDNDGAAGATDDSGVASDAGSGEENDAGVGSIGNADCPANVLETGTPLATYACGSVSTTTGNTGEATGLENDQLYAVAVATKDRVGNIGPLSQIGCGTPVLVTDFFEAYREAGGKGGGGFCATGRGKASHALIFVLGALVMLILRRRHVV